MSTSKTKTIYHYCSLETFLQIIKNKTIRMSDINKSNDRLECRALVDSIKAVTLDLLVQYENDFPAILIYGVNNETALKHFVNLFFDKIMSDDDKLTYAACFSEECDLLSQWCQYADNGNGVAIGFNLDILKEICNSSDGALKIDKVQYLDPLEKNTSNIINDNAEKFAKDLISIILGGEMRELIENPYSSGFFSHLDSQILFTDSVFFKNAAFGAEKEWRILIEDDGLYKSSGKWMEYFNWSENEHIGNICDLMPRGIEFKSEKNDICSYMDLSFKKYDEIIDNIVLGPNCRLSVDDIVQIMNHFYFELFNDTNINKSRCPYIAR